MCDSSRQPAVLCIGQDRRLLESRALVIRRRFNCTTANDLHDVQSLTSEHFSLVVLCHSLDALEYRMCVDFVRSRWPEAPIIRITSVLLVQADEPELAISNQPADLLQALEIFHCTSSLSQQNPPRIEFAVKPGHVRVAVAGSIFEQTSIEDLHDPSAVVD